MDQRIIRLYDEFTHGHLDRRLFLERLAGSLSMTVAVVCLMGAVYNSLLLRREGLQDNRLFGSPATSAPPVALSAYFLKGVVPQWSLKEIYAGMMQFMVLQVTGMGIVMVFPGLATWLPIALRV